jgi:hypothetical protein
MPLSIEDHIAILRRLQSALRQVDPELQSLVVEHVESSDDPRRHLLDYLSVLARLMSERSSGAHGMILNTINRSMRTETGGPVRGIRLELSPIEREDLQREHVDLAALPDRTQIVERLKALHDDILREDGDLEDKR